MTKLSSLFTWRSAICESTLPSTTRHVALALSLYMNERGGSAYPGGTRLAKDTGLNIRTVKRALSQLELEGWLHVVEKGGSNKGGKRVATEYRATFDRGSSDRGHSATGDSDDNDRWPWVRGPGVVRHPISSVNSSTNSQAIQRCVCGQPLLVELQACPWCETPYAPVYEVLGGILPELPASEAS